MSTNEIIITAPLSLCGPGQRISTRANQGKQATVNIPSLINFGPAKQPPGWMRRLSTELQSELTDAPFGKARLSLPYQQRPSNPGLFLGVDMIHARRWK